MLPTIREIEAGEKWRAVPNKFDIHEWDLQRAIHGRGAFRMFRATIEDAGVHEEWFAFKHQALRDIARESLQELGVPYR